MFKGLILFFICLFSLFNTNVVWAGSNPRPPLEKFYSDFGFKHVEAAWNECMDHFSKEFKLPYKLPPLGFTHQFGKCDKKNYVFEVMLINEDAPKRHYKIRVHPIEHKMTFTDKFIDRKYELDNGIEAFYITKLVQSFNLLVFEREDFQYTLTIDKRMSEKVPPGILVDIANSF